MNAPVAGYVRTNEREDVLVSLEACDLILPLIPKRPQQWKWVLVTAHNALQGSMVCALSGTAGLGALDNRSAATMFDYLEKREKSKPYPRERLAKFEELLCRVCLADNMQQLDGKPLNLTRQQENDLKKLNAGLRNQFIHFTPKGWSIEEAGLPRITRAAIDATDQLMGHPSVSLHLSSAQRAWLQSSVSSIRTRLASL